MKRLIAVALILAGAITLGRPAPARAAEPAASAADQRAREAVVTAVAINNLYLIAAGQLVARKAASPTLKARAQAIVAEASTAYEALENPALAAGVPFPTSIDYQRRRWLEDLEKAAPSELAKVFAEQQRASAQQALDLVTAYMATGDGFYVKEYAARAAPRLKEIIARTSTSQVAD